jgi:hypothetical protein
LITVFWLVGAKPGNSTMGHSPPSSRSP